MKPLWKAVLYVAMIGIIATLNLAFVICGWPWLQLMEEPCRHLKTMLEQEHALDAIGRVLDWITEKLRHFWR